MRYQHAALAALVGGHGLLRHAQLFGELHLGQTLLLAQPGDAPDQLDEEGPGLAKIATPDFTPRYAETP